MKNQQLTPETAKNIEIFRVVYYCANNECQPVQFIETSPTGRTCKVRTQGWGAAAVEMTVKTSSLRFC